MSKLIPKPTSEVPQNLRRSKTKIQVQNYLSNHTRYRSQKDLAFIQAFCLDKLGWKHESPVEFNDDGLTSDKFYDWFEKGFGIGDVVFLDDTDENIGIVAGNVTGNGGGEDSKDDGKIGICFRIVFNCPLTDYIIVDEQSIHHADENALNRLKMALEENQLEFRLEGIQITEKFMPTEGSSITFDNLQTFSKGGGIVKRIDPETNLVYMYCYYDGDDVYYGDDLCLGNAYDFIFTPTISSDYSRRKLAAKLGKVGMSWNHSLKRLEPNDLRNIGGDYWSINDKLMVVKKKDTDNSSAYARYKCGNYFNSEERAKEFVRRVLEAVRQLYMIPSEEFVRKGKKAEEKSEEKSEEES